MNENKIKFIGIILVCLLSSCSAEGLQKAENLSQEAREFYSAAVKEYQRIIVSSADKETAKKKLGALYFESKDYEQTATVLKDLADAESRKMLAISLFRLGNYTDALEVFNRIKDDNDSEWQYFHALTCEKLNLYDQAKKIYSRIKSPEYLKQAKERLRLIESLPAPVQENGKIEGLLKNSPGIQEYPQAGALILSADEAIEITGDNREITESHFIIKILNERGRGFAEVDIDYDSTYEKAELVFARTIKPDGAVVNAGAKHIRDVSRYLDFPLYSNARALIVSMPEVVDAAIIEYKIRITRNKLIADKEFSVAYPLQEDEPILYARLKLTIPDGREVSLLKLNQQFNTFKARLEPSLSKGQGRKTYIWEFKDIPQIIAEPLMPPLSEVAPSFIVSSFKSWEEIYNWWWKLAAEKIDSNPEMRSTVKKLTAGKDSAEEKARAIYNWCIRNIRYVGIEYGDAGYEPHKASEIFANKYGDCKDQAILLISLLQEAGIEAYPVLIGTKGTFKLEEAFPCLPFNHCIAAVPIDDKLIFLDPTAETVSFGDLPAADQGRKVLVFFKDHGGIISTPSFPATHNRVVKNTYIRVNPDESMEASRQVVTFGNYDQGQRFRFKYTRPVLIEEFLKETVHSIVPGGRLLEYHIENVEDMDKPVRLSYKFRGPSYLVRAGKARVINLSGISTTLVAKDQRNFDIDFNLLNIEESTTVIELPQNITLKFMPEALKFDTPWTEMNNEYAFKDNKLILTAKSIQKKKIIPREEYPKFKAALEELAEKSKQCIILERIDNSQSRK